jgi:hypothetical protein
VRQIAARTTRIRELESELAQLVCAYAPQLLAERGCGPLTAAKLIGEIAGADRFSTDAKLARTSGTAPIPASTGQTNRHRLDRGGNRQLNCALHRLAVNKANWDPDTAAYLEPKQQQGKSRKEALRCLKRHLPRRVWKLLHTPPAPAAPPPGSAERYPRDDRQNRPRAHALFDIGATSVSPEIARALARARVRADVVVIDTPPIGVVHDAIALTNLVDARSSSRV